MYKIGRLTVITGPMFAGKSTELTNEYHIKQTVGKLLAFYFKPTIDTRDPKGQICTHAGYTQEGVYCIDPNNDSAIIDIVVKHLNHKKIYVFIDELQFFNLTIINVMTNLLHLGCNIMSGGLITDYRGKSFETVSQAIGMADTVIIKKAICLHVLNDGTYCNEPAIFSQMFANGKPVIDESQGRIHIGASETYETRCRQHFVVAGIQTENILASLKAEQKKHCMPVY